MRTVSQIVALGLLACVASLEAGPAKEGLKPMVAKLRETPSDGLLRKKIIKLARSMRPRPEVPDAAVEFEGRAQFAFKQAGSEADLLAAAAEYEKAVAIAPWVPGYYADLCTIYEKAKRFADAKRNCEFYLSSLSDPAEMKDMKRQIAGLKYGMENSPEAKAAGQAAKDAALIRSLDGAVFSNEVVVGETKFRNIFEVHGQEIHKYDEVIKGAGYSFQSDVERPSMRNPGDNNKPPRIWQIQGRKFAVSVPWQGEEHYFEIAEDGKSIQTMKNVKGKVMNNKAENDGPCVRIR